jgi:hypothetical protein
MSDAFNPFDAADQDGFQYQDENWDAVNATLNTTFAPDAFDFPAAGGDGGGEDVSANLLQAPVLFPDDPFSVQSNGAQYTIHVALHEQLTCMYDGNDSAPSSQVEGSIHVRSSSTNPFSLLMRDRSKHMDSFHVDPKYCVTVTNDADALLGDRLLKIVLPSSSAKKQKIASYTCGSQLRPIPLLVKNKVVVEGDRCRVGVKVRSNPANQRHLTQVAILMAVPPDIRGESVKLTRQGGVWDGMKRIVAWPIEKGLAPGELIEIQAQFNFVSPSGGHLRAAPKFPILVRCGGSNDQFSDVQLCSDLHESQGPVNMSLSRTVRILHRKV